MDTIEALSTELNKMSDEDRAKLRGLVQMLMKLKDTVDLGKTLNIDNVVEAEVIIH